MGIMKSEELSALLFKKNKMKDKTKAKKRHRKKGKQIRLMAQTIKTQVDKGKRGKKEKKSLVCYRV
jgi:hypothetical protein